VAMPQIAKAGKFQNATFIVGGLLVSFILSPVRANEEIVSLLMDYDGKQRIRRLHVNHINGLASAVEFLKSRYDDESKGQS